MLWVSAPLALFVILALVSSYMLRLFHPPVRVALGLCFLPCSHWLSSPLGSILRASFLGSSIGFILLATLVMHQLFPPSGEGCYESVLFVALTLVVFTLGFFLHASFLGFSVGFHRLVGRWIHRLESSSLAPSSATPSAFLGMLDAIVAVSSAMSRIVKCFPPVRVALGVCDCLWGQVRVNAEYCPPTRCPLAVCLKIFWSGPHFVPGVVKIR